MTQAKHACDATIYATLLSGEWCELGALISVVDIVLVGIVVVSSGFVGFQCSGIVKIEKKIKRPTS